MREPEATTRRARPDLSVVIVSYNVLHFLHQCLNSVERACRDLTAEVFVVDNASSDGSVEHVARHFPWVRLIASPDNLGFSRGNNLAIREARGRYVLLLNPDTLIPEDAFATCLRVADAEGDIGAIGARMIDGTGRFLPESKRGFPTPWVSFTKMSGLARLRRGTRRFDGYYLGHIGEHERADVDVLTGAYMWLRREALEAAGGGLDEDYFMYGEDIDLSYLVQRAGYRNVYLPAVSIVHYKGESTRKGSLRYVRSFYQAMALFADKHLGLRGSRLRKTGLLLAIYSREALAHIVNAWRRIALPAADALGLASLLLTAKAAWARYYFGDASYFASAPFSSFAVPLYVSTWLFALRVLGAYDRPYRILPALRGVGAGALAVLAVYALLPETLRTSRAIIVLAALGAALVLPLIRLAIAVWRPALVAHTADRKGGDRRLAVVGAATSAQQVLATLARAGIRREYVGRITPDPSDPASPATEVLAEQPIGDADGLLDLTRRYRIEELIFCLGDVGVATAITAIDGLPRAVERRTFAPGATAIVGSPSPDAPGDLYTLASREALRTARGRRSKRLFDLAVAASLLALGLLTFPARRARHRTRNAWRVLVGGATWVGYAPGGQLASGLPRLRPGIVPVAPADADPMTVDRLNALYARHYRPGDDWQVLRSAEADLARTPAAIADIAPPRWPVRALPVHPATGSRYADLR